MPNRIAREVGHASLALANALPATYPRPTFPNMLVEVAKRLQRAQTKRIKLRRELKAVEGEIRTHKRELKALAAQIKTGG